MSWFKKIFGKEEAEIAAEKQKKNFVPDKEKVEKLLDDFVFVEGGTFIMGSPETEEGRFNNEAEHEVTVDSFYMQSSVVTQELWESVMGNNPSIDKTWTDLPVTNVTWFDCQEFNKKINELTGKSYRLPTEAEWEYAAKGGNQSKGYIYIGSNNLKEVAWYSENSGGRLHVVKELQANELGLYDMGGNVWEWCADCYAPYRLDKKGNVNPQGPDSGSSRVLRGGSWDNIAQYCRSAYRYGYIPDGSSYLYGFRLLRTK